MKVRLQAIGALGGWLLDKKAFQTATMFAAVLEVGVEAEEIASDMSQWYSKSGQKLIFQFEEALVAFRSTLDKLAEGNAHQRPNMKQDFTWLLPLKSIGIGDQENVG